MRIVPKPPRAYPWYLRPFFWNQRRKYGHVLDAALLWARVPKLFVGIAGLYGAIDRKGSPLEPALRSLLTVRVSQINHCRFCVDINSATLLERGISEDKLWALEGWRGSNLFAERERSYGVRFTPPRALTRWCDGHQFPASAGVGHGHHVTHSFPGPLGRPSSRVPNE